MAHSTLAETFWVLRPHSTTLFGGNAQIKRIWPRISGENRDSENKHEGQPLHGYGARKYDHV